MPILRSDLVVVLYASCLAPHRVVVVIVVAGVVVVGVSISQAPSREGSVADRVCWCLNEIRSVCLSSVEEQPLRQHSVELSKIRDGQDGDEDVR